MATLVATSLSKSFGGLAAVHDVTFEARAGEVLSIIGPQRRRQNHGVQLTDGF